MILVYRENQNTHLSVICSKLTGCFQTVDIWKANVRDHDYLAEVGASSMAPAPSVASPMTFIASSVV
ncbi:MAG: hypothetical protein VYC64_02715, partial [Candidatus Latescibacterota bacterium]|nr:hypothetical protein [Candidatus Latescibacterota bacterium]